jgi:2-polyprenyl-3-methyl-5-hydroxy-6-metoxy-1,4-benzoquinol methylase
MNTAVGTMDPQPLAERSVPGLHDSLIARLPQRLEKSAAILDVGCGTGAWLRRLGAHGYTHLHGTDADVQQFGFPGASVFRNDLNDLHWSVGNARYDLISAIEIIEHLENIGIFLSNVRSLLADDGVLLLTTPNVHSLPTRLRFFLTGDMKQFGRLGDPTHVFPVLTATLERLLARHGLQVAERWGYPENGRNVTSRQWVNLLGAALRTVIPEPLPGDVACYLIRSR